MVGTIAEPGASIGWYAHHHGMGHIARAAAVRRHLPGITVFSSRPAPDTITLPMDIAPPRSAACAAIPDPVGLHYAPIGVDDLRRRTTTLAAWVATHDPAMFVVDVSVEVATLMRLLSVPTAIVRQHGRRDDPPHAMAYANAQSLIAPWPRWLEDPKTPDAVVAATTYVGGFSRFDDRTVDAAASRSRLGVAADERLVVVLAGAGGRVPWPVGQAVAATPGWRWVVVGREWLGTGGAETTGWVPDPFDWLCAADVVVTHAGHNAVMEVASAGRPSVVIPLDRPHDEQRCKAAVLNATGVAVVRPDWPDPHDWPDLLERVLTLDPEPREHLCDGEGAPTHGTAPAGPGADLRKPARLRVPRSRCASGGQGPGIRRCRTPTGNDVSAAARSGENANQGAAHPVPPPPHPADPSRPSSPRNRQPDDASPSSVQLGGALSQPITHADDRPVPVDGSPLRIALIASLRHGLREPHAGGLERHTADLARTLRTMGHEVRLFASGDADPALGVEAICPRESRLDLSPAARRDVSMLSQRFMDEHHAFLDLMLRLSTADDVDIVHDNSLHHLPLAMAAMVRVPVVKVLHTPPTPWLEAAMSHASATVHLVSVSAANASAWPTTVHDIIHNGVDIDRFAAGPGGGPALWSGRMVPEKAPHLALLAAHRADLPLDLAGPAADPGYVEEKVRPLLDGRRRWLGHLTADALADALGRASVAVVTPAWDEPYGLVVAEALACGTPVAGIARGALPELVPSEVGVLVPDGDPEAMTAALADAMRVAARLDRAACRAHATRTMTLEQMAADYVEVYRRCIAAAGRPTSTGVAA